MKLYIIRHADPDYENDAITERGIREAAALGLRSRDFALTHLYSSPLGRARRTAQDISQNCGLTPVILDWTRELHNLESLTPYGYLAAWDVPPEFYMTEEKLVGRKSPHLADDMPLYNETLSIYDKVCCESDRFLADFGYRREGLRYAVDTHSDAQVALVCHLGFGLTLLSHLLGIPLDRVWAGFWFAPASVTEILLEERSEKWAVPRMISLGDVSHLSSRGIGGNTKGLRGNLR